MGTTQWNCIQTNQFFRVQTKGRRIRSRRYKRGHYIAATNDCLKGNRYEVLAHFHYMSFALAEKISTTGIDKWKVWCCTVAGRGRRKGGEPPRKEAVRVRKSPDWIAPNKPIFSRTNQGRRTRTRRFWCSWNRNSLAEKILTTKIDKQKVWCCTTAGWWRQTQAQCAWVLKSPDFDTFDKPILSRTN